MTKLQRQECQRCGRGIPPRRRDTGFCSVTCALQQDNEDRASAESERAVVNDNVRVGPTFEHCLECGGTNDDGYTDVVHFASCSKAPKGKRAKMEPTRVNIEDLPPDLRALFEEKSDVR